MDWMDSQIERGSAAGMQWDWLKGSTQSNGLASASAQQKICCCQISKIPLRRCQGVLNRKPLLLRIFGWSPIAAPSRTLFAADLLAFGMKVIVLCHAFRPRSSNDLPSPPPANHSSSHPGMSPVEWVTGGAQGKKKTILHSRWENPNQ